MPPSAFQDTEISTHDLTKRSTRNISKLRQFFVISTHDLTKRSTNRLLSLLVFQLHFNSRPHEEVDFGRLAPRTNALNFISRPHEEVDWIICRRIVWKEISTHDLTKRSTNDELTDDDLLGISTHDLTKRSTGTKLGVYPAFCISTHDLTKRSTAQRVVDAMVGEFQLTTSRRGRQMGRQ